MVGVLRQGAQQAQHGLAPLLHAVRLRLTLLYLLVGVTLVVAVGGSTYGVLGYYFSSSTDLALRFRMAGEFRQLGLTPPTNLQDAEAAWLSGRVPGTTMSVGPTLAPRGGRDLTRELQEQQLNRTDGDEAFNANLASIFVLPLSAQGDLLYNPNRASAPMAPDLAAVRQASLFGHDLRTVALANGNRVRLLTYRLPALAALAGRAVPGDRRAMLAPTYLQTGRLLTDQDQARRQLLESLLAVGGISTVLLATASWWLAGRTLRPAHASWERQRAFVANASHELRAPLTLLRATVEFALRTLPVAPSPAPTPATLLPTPDAPDAATLAAERPAADSPPGSRCRADNAETCRMTPAEQEEQRALLQDALRECDHMTHLVEDLLLLSRLDAGRLTLDRDRVELAPLIEQVARQAGRLAAERGVQLAITRAEGMVWGDPARLRQVLLVLVDNALRYTPSGGRVQIESQCRGHQVQLSVRDTGPGIAPEHLPHVFERFYRASHGRDAAGAEGTGLGLAIARSLIEAHHGTIRLASRPGDGTTASVTLPGAE